MLCFRSDRETSVPSHRERSPQATDPLNVGNQYPRQYITQIPGRRSQRSEYERLGNYSAGSGYEVPVGHYDHYEVIDDYYDDVEAPYI